MTRSAEVVREADPVVPRGTTIAITGATGFIGGRLVERLVAQGAIVTCLLRKEPGDALRRAGAGVRVLDLADPEAVRAALRRVAITFHCAFDWSDTLWNHGALRALIAATAASGGRLVHVSSFVVYQIPPEGEVTEDTPDTDATEGYAHTKLALERDLLRAVRDEGVQASIVQPTVVYGPGSKPWTIDPGDMLHYGTVVLPDEGGGSCNAIYVDDVVSAMILAATRAEAVGQRFLVSGPSPVTWKQFYQGMADAIGAPGPRFRPGTEIATAPSRGGGRLAILRRLARDPARVARRIAHVGPARRLLWSASAFLPEQARGTLRELLWGPETRRRGHVHVPDPGRLGFLQGRSTIHAGKARAVLGFAPRFDLVAGMAPTGRYLRDRYAAER